MDSELREEMLSSKGPMRFASYNPDGFPHVVPVWHAYIDDAIYFDTDLDSVKTRNVERTGVGAGVIDEGMDYSELRGVLVQGRCEVIEDEDKREEVVLHNLEKYFDGEIPSFVQQRNESMERCVVKLSMEHVTSWDFRNVFGD